MSTLRRRLKGYRHTSDIIWFGRRARQRPDVAALILFGSLAKGDFYEHSDADVCLILQQPTVQPLLRDVDPFWLETPPGIIELHMYGSQQFKQMVCQAHGLALEVMYHGLVLTGDEPYLTDLERLFEETRKEFNIVQLGQGWIIGHKRKSEQ